MIHVTGLQQQMETRIHLRALGNRWADQLEAGVKRLEMTGTISRTVLLTIGTIVLATAALGQGLTVETNDRVFDHQGRETDVSVLRNDTEERQDFDVLKNGAHTKGYLDPGSTMTVISRPGEAPLIVLSPRDSK